MKSHETLAPDLAEFLRRRPGRKRKAQITLPSRNDVPEDLLPLRAKVSLAIEGDPLGIKTGQYAARPRYGVGEATPERMRHIREGRSWLQEESQKHKDGSSTGLRRKRIKSQLEVWSERGTISRQAFIALTEYQRLHDIVQSRGAAVTASYQPQIAVSHRELMPIEQQADYIKDLALATGAVDPLLRGILEWVCVASNADVSAEKMAGFFWPELGERTRTERFRGLLEFCGAALSRHFGHKEKHRWASVERAASELNELLA